MKVTVERLVKADIAAVWKAWNDPDDIVQWNAASDDWHTTKARVDLREGGSFSARMEARDGSMGFDFEGVFTHVVPERSLAYRMEDGREVSVDFAPLRDGILITETFDAETENPPEMQRQGWQAILDNFARHVEAKAKR